MESPCITLKCQYHNIYLIIIIFLDKYIMKATLKTLQKERNVREIQQFHIYNNACSTTISYYNRNT